MRQAWGLCVALPLAAALAAGCGGSGKGSSAGAEGGEAGVADATGGANTGGAESNSGGADVGVGGDSTGSGGESPGVGGQAETGGAGGVESGSGGQDSGGAAGQDPGTGGSTPGGAGGQAQAGAGGQAIAGAGGQDVAGAGGEATAGNGGQQIAGNGGRLTAGAGGEVAAGAGGQAMAGAAGLGEAGAGGEPTAGAGGGGTAGGGGASAGAGGAGDAGGAGGEGGSGVTCNPVVDLFPVPISDETSLFFEYEDASLNVPFELGFTFSFYGLVYSGIYLNTNGGMTFGYGTGAYDPSAASIDIPSIAVFWGDMSAGVHTTDRANQMVYQQCADRFIVTYTELYDWWDENVDNTATVTLFANGTIEIQYGSVETQYLLVGVFDGTHTNDQYVSLQASYDYLFSGTGTILFDGNGSGPLHTGELSNQTITFYPL